MYHADDYLVEVDTTHERARKARAPLVKIYVLKSVRDGRAVKSHAEHLGLGVDYTEEAGMFIVAATGSFMGLACVQSYIDGMYRC